MLQIGNFNELKVKKETSFGLYLDSEAGEILIPNKYVPPGTKIGDTLRVFIYRDSEDRLIATTLTPKGTVGEFVYLQVRDINKYGAFLDWGLEKDLLVPQSEQPVKMQKGGKYIVRICLDKVTDRIIATGKTDKFIEKELIELKEGQEINLLVREFTELGIKVIIDNKYSGMLYKNDVYQKLEVGDQITGYVKKVREDKKIDVTVRKSGYEEIQNSKNIIAAKLEEKGGFLPLTDKSSPEVIKEVLQMSKKNFKKGVGGLYKEGIIELGEEGIKLKKQN